ncbi:Set3 complex subunit, partial [Ascosphaera aggregata]
DSANGHQTGKGSSEQSGSSGAKTTSTFDSLFDDPETRSQQQRSHHGDYHHHHHLHDDDDNDSSKVTFGVEDQDHRDAQNEVKAEQNRMDIDFDDIPVAEKKEEKDEEKHHEATRLEGGQYEVPSSESGRSHDHDHDHDHVHDNDDDDDNDNNDDDDDDYDDAERAAAEKAAEEERFALARKARELREAAEAAERAAHRAYEAARSRVAEEGRRRREMEQRRAASAAKEEEDRRRRVDRERARLAAARREKDEIERRRREKLPNMLRVAAEYIGTNDPRAKEHAFLRHFNPIFYVTTRMLEWAESSTSPSGSPSNTAAAIMEEKDESDQESWIPNFLVAPLLGTNDLRLSQYMTWEKREATATQRQCLWRVSRRCMIKEGDVNPLTLTAESVFSRVGPTRELFLAMEHIFWVKLSDFKEIVPHIPHLQGLKMKYVKMHLDHEPEEEEKGVGSTEDVPVAVAKAAGDVEDDDDNAALVTNPPTAAAVPLIHPTAEPTSFPLPFFDGANDARKRQVTAPAAVAAVAAAGTTASSLSPATSGGAAMPRQMVNGFSNSLTLSADRPSS